MKIGSWWLANHEAQTNETVEWSCFANRTQSSNRAVGGKLFVTNQRLLFSPHLLDWVLGGKKWETDLQKVVQVGILAKGGDTFGGGLRDRLRIDVQNGGIELFVINKINEVTERIHNAVFKK